MGNQKDRLNEIVLLCTLNYMLKLMGKKIFCAQFFFIWMLVNKTLLEFPELVVSPENRSQTRQICRIYTTGEGYFREA